ncbi:MAG: SoxR reducing system RseC family protein [Bacteroidales bacterium]|nr:SoxR reducing system RseC family protein [Bacteroidales bacterium]
MNDLTDLISHPGIVDEIDREIIRVKILSVSACSSCQVKGICNMAEMQEKMVDVKNNQDGRFSVGDNVNVVMKRSLGTKALLLGYIIPFLIIFISLIILVSIMNHEGLAGLISLSLVGPYYLILYLKRDKIKRTFEFSIQ